MAAQNGADLALAYGPQGAQQLGGAITLDFASTSTATTITGGTRARWGGIALVTQGTAAPFGGSAEKQLQMVGVWSGTRSVDELGATAWDVAAAVDDRAAALWGRYERRLHADRRSRWSLAAAVDDRSAAPWGRYERRLHIERRGGWGVALPLDGRSRALWLGPMLRLQPEHRARFGAPVSADLRQWVPWVRFGRELAPGWGIVTPVDPGPVPEALFYILPARFYMTVHSITAERLPDLAEVPIYDVSLAADAGSFGWSFSASGPASLFELLAPSLGLPTQLRVTVDDLQWVFVVETVRRNREFGKAAVSIGGRSATALIGAPWQRSAARTNAEARTAQQLAADALALSGVGVDWGLTDWLVPAGAWNHQGTPLAAVQAIAEAAGGHVLSHRSNATLLVRHPYPTAPWEWGAGVADVELAPDAIITSAIERRDGPDINAVYVSGTSQGVLAWVKRTGTAGEKLAAMVADPLMTHVDGARQRGLAVLGAAGAKHNVTLDLPVLTGASEPGVLDVGQLVQINEAVPWRGRVRAVNVRGGRPVVRQSVTLERHL